MPSSAVLWALSVHVVHRHTYMKAKHSHVEIKAKKPFKK